MTPAPSLCRRCHNPLPDADLSANAEGLCPVCAGAPASEAETVAPASAPLALLSATAAPEVPGYEILGELGRGGMGVVYHARHLKLDRPAAIKVLPQDSQRDPTFAERFSREARALARLSHPHIVTIHDFGQAGGLSYFVMEYVAGDNLRRRLKEGPLPAATAVAIAVQVCDALQYAHDEGIVHRDVKPENILLDKRGRVKIADFGIAKLLTATTAGYTLTGPWQVVGTLNYMAPEQLDNPLGLDRRADIYALGVVLYEMLTGQLPRGRFPSPSATPGVETGLDAVVLRALELEPQRRYQQAGELQAALAPFLAATSTSVAPGSEGLPNVRLCSATPLATYIAPRPGAQGPPGFVQATQAGKEHSTAGKTSLLGGAEKVLEAESAHIRHQLRSPAGWLLVAGIVYGVGLVPWIVGAVALITVEHKEGRGMRGGDILMLISVIVGFGIGCGIGAFMIGAGRRMEQLASYEFSRFGCIAAMLPLSFGWFLSLPIGIWVFRALLQPGVLEAFERQRGRSRSQENPVHVLVRRRAWWLFGVGIVYSLFPAYLSVALLLELASYNLDWGAFFVLMLSALVTIMGGTIAFASWKMKNLEDYQFARICCVLAMLPLSPGWLLSCPVGIEAYRTLSRPEVREAFAARQR
jgi:hypothetical protein